MASAWKMDIRPRNAGEILDDAWRLFFSSALLLITLAALFIGPFVACLMLVLTLPVQADPVAQVLRPALTAFLLPVTGLGSAACQEVFRHRAEGRPAPLKDCLAAARRRGASHMAARAVVCLGFAPGLAVWAWARTAQPILAVVGIVGGAFLVLLPGIALWVAATTVHPILALSDAPWLNALKAGTREVQRYPGKALLVLLCRPLLLLLAVLNLHLFLHLGLWAAETLVGVEVPLLKLLMSLTNPLYGLVLVLVAWVFLTPYAEACNYLLHIDARARFEGLDLWFRVQRLFPALQKGRAGVVLLALAAGLPSPAKAQAAPGYEAVRTVRQGVAAVRQEVASADPYAGVARWLPRLRSFAEQLSAAKVVKNSPNSWFRKTVDGLPHRQREGVLQGLDGLEHQLSLLEESLNPALRAGPALSGEQIKALLPDQPAEEAKEAPKAEEPPPPPEEPPPNEPGEGRGHRYAGGAGIVEAQPTGGGGGFGKAGLMILAGLFAAVLIAGGVLFWRGRDRTPAKQKVTTVEKPEVSLEAALAEPDQHTGSLLWRQADDLARRGRFVEAVRALYLAVLAHLHWAKLIRYERTRTNGEYVRQLRSRETLHRPFEGMTSLFEVKWYGERSCQSDDYARCRALAEEIRSEVGSAR